jgi:hypothetical protein
MRPQLRDRVLTVIAAANPDTVSVRRLCITLPVVSPRQVTKAATTLRNDGNIEMASGRIRIKETLLAAPEPRYTPSGFIRPPTRERLMAGR